jgi:hypothetical protein
MKGRAALEAISDVARDLFDTHWRGERSDWAALERYVAWVVQMRELCVRYDLTAQTLSFATKPRPDISQITALGRRRTGSVRRAARRGRMAGISRATSMARRRSTARDELDHRLGHGLGDVRADSPKVAASPPRSFSLWRWLLRQPRHASRRFGGISATPCSERFSSA